MKYFNIDGKEISLDRLCREEPEWAANVIRVLKEKNKLLKDKIKTICNKE